MKKKRFTDIETRMEGKGMRKKEGIIIIRVYDKRGIY